MTYGDFHCLISVDYVDSFIKNIFLSCNRSPATSLCVWGSAATESVTNMHGAAWKFRRACQTLVAVCSVPHWHATDTSVVWAQTIVTWSRHHLNSQTVSPYLCLYKHTHTHTPILNRTQVPSMNWWFNWRHVLHFCPNYPCSIKQIYFHETLTHTKYFPSRMPFNLNEESNSAQRE